MYALILLACTPAAVDSTTWTPPNFDGDGLPPSEDTDHGERPDTAATTDSGDTATSASVPTILVADGLFTYVNYGAYGIIGILALLTETAGCEQLLGGAGAPDGIYHYLYGDKTNLSEGWTGTWNSCGAPPCSDAFWILGGAFGYLEGELEITRYDAHYLTLDWSNAASTGTGLTIYNCGDVVNWN